METKLVTVKLEFKDNPELNQCHSIETEGEALIIADSEEYFTCPLEQVIPEFLKHVFMCWGYAWEVPGLSWMIDAYHKWVDEYQTECFALRKKVESLEDEIEELKKNG